jgi:hypothetical protein
MAHRNPNRLARAVDGELAAAARCASGGHRWGAPDGCR